MGAPPSLDIDITMRTFKLPTVNVIMGVSTGVPVQQGRVSPFNESLVLYSQFSDVVGWLDLLFLTNLHWSAIPLQWERMSVAQGRRFRGAVDNTNMQPM